MLRLIRRFTISTPLYWLVAANFWSRRVGKLQLLFSPYWVVAIEEITTSY